MIEEDGMATKKSPDGNDWQTTIAFCTAIVCLTAIALALILS